jgi:hypothetical protein
METQEWDLQTSKLSVPPPGTPHGKCGDEENEEQHANVDQHSVYGKGVRSAGGSNAQDCEQGYTV